MPSGHSNQLCPFCCRFKGFEPITLKPSNPFAMSCASCWLCDSALRARKYSKGNSAHFSISTLWAIQSWTSPKKGVSVF